VPPPKPAIYAPVAAVAAVAVEEEEGDLNEAVPHNPNFVYESDSDSDSAEKARDEYDKKIKDMFSGPVMEEVRLIPTHSSLCSDFVYHNIIYCDYI